MAACHAYAFMSTYCLFFYFIFIFLEVKVRNVRCECATYVWRTPNALMEMGGNQYKNKKKLLKKIPNGDLTKNAISVMVRDGAKETKISDHNGYRSQIPNIFTKFKIL